MDPLHLMQLAGSLATTIMRWAFFSLGTWCALWVLVQIAPWLLLIDAKDSPPVRWLKRALERRMLRAILAIIVGTAIWIVDLMF